ncbi:MAG: carbohydrate kinase family protein [Chloroflexales bacterium]|nr:carbohydrate kinase family protein [Chloroflexales bacterium]
MSVGHDVVVVGNVGIDTNVYLHSTDVDWTVEANFTNNVDCIGQAGGYTARGFRALGYRTAFIGHVGDDMGGRLIREVFTHEGIDTSVLWTDPQGTARSVNIVYPDGRRKNFYDGKGHMTLTPDLEQCRQVLAGAKLVHVHIPNWARHVLSAARACGALIACDLQDLRTLDDPYRQDFIAAADIIFFSSANVGDPTALLQLLLHSKPERIVVVGMGEQGCALGTREGVRLFALIAANRGSGCIEALGTREGVRLFAPLDLGGPAVDTNGAGDGLAVGFLASYALGGHAPEIAVQHGQAVARLTCAQSTPKTPISWVDIERTLGGTLAG